MGEIQNQHAILDIGAVSPILEAGSYEALWAEPGQSFRRFSDFLHSKGLHRPLVEFVPEQQSKHFADWVISDFERNGCQDVSLKTSLTWDFPETLSALLKPLPMLYYRGNWDLIHTRCISIVGSRKASAEGQMRATRIAKIMVETGFTIVSGMAKGIDTAAHKAALESGGKTIAVLGTPIHKVYPKENQGIYNELVANHLVISQVPVYRHAQGHPGSNKVWFPERNATMSAISEGTIIVEAGDTSGTLTQARHAMQQGRKLFILNNCFENPKLTWPAKYEASGAIRVREPADILEHLSSSE